MTQSDYEDTMRRGSIIENLAEELKQLAEDLNSLSLEIKPHWRGRAAEAYVCQCEKLHGSIETTAGDMTNVGRLIKQTATAAKALSDAAVQAQ